MRLIKENLYDIVRLYIFQIGIMIFSLFLYMPIGFIEDETLFTQLRVIASIGAVIFYFVLVYSMMWEMGAKDKLKIDGGRLKAQPHKGLVLGLCANVPNFLLGILATVFAAICASGAGINIQNTFAIIFLITGMHGAMYLGIIQIVTPFPVVGDLTNYSNYLVQSILYIVIPLISVAVVHFSYYLGTKEKKLFGFLSKKK